MKSLEVKIAYLNDDYKIVERNKEFYSYFEGVGFLYENIEDFVMPSQRQEFLDFVKSSPGKDVFRAYSLKKNNEEFKDNIVSIGEEVLNGKSYHALRIIDISNGFEFFNEANLFEKKVNFSLGITNEYLFSYQKSTNVFKMHNFLQNRRVAICEQDIDSWKEQMISEGQVEESDIEIFRQSIDDLKKCNETFMTCISSSLRSAHSVYEKLSFKAVRMEEHGEVFMVGQVIPEVLLEQLEKSSEILQELKIDALTGAYNKKAIMNFAEKRFVPGTKENAMLAIVDLDHFKPVNDAYGHLAGDKVLSEAGKILKNIVGEGGVVGRYGGDEFLLILEDMDDENNFRALFRTINNDIRAAFENMFSDIKVTASIGAAMYSKDGDSFDELFKKADFCLYRAKDKGRDRYVFFRTDLHGELYKQATAAKTEGIKYDVREVLELKSMADFLLNLGSAPKSAIQTVLEHMLKTYNLSAIHIYYGPEAARMFSIGDTTETLARAEYINSPVFKSALDGKAFIRVDFITEMSENAKEFGKILEQRGVKSSIQCILGTIEKPLGLVTFDRLKEAAMWAEYEVNCCVMFSAALNLLSEEKLKELFCDIM